MNTAFPYLRLSFIFLALTFNPTSIFGENLQVGSEASYADVCSALAAATPGDTIEVSESSSIGHCTSATADLTVKGIGQRPILKIESGVTGWSIAAENMVIENIAFEGARCEDGSCAAIELLSGTLKLRNVSITGSDIGLKAQNSEGSSLSIENSEIFGNASNIRVGSIARFELISSYVHHALGGAVVETAAAENVIRNNRLASGTETTASGELTLLGSRSTELTGNVLLRNQSSSTAGLVQFIDQAAEPGEILAERNTFVSAATSGIEFIESIGDRVPSLRLDRNIFWGDGSADQLANREGAGRNYFGVDNVFRAAAADFHLEGDYVPADWGAAAAADGEFPLSIPEQAISAEAVEAIAEANPVTEQEAEGSRKDRIQSAITGVSPASVSLSSTVVGGSTFLWTNRVNLTSPAPSGGVSVYITSSNTAVVRVLTPSVVVPAGATGAVFSLQTILPSSPTSVTIRATANGGSAAAVMQVGAVSISRITMGATQIGSNASINSNRIELTGPAPAGGLVVGLSSSSTAAYMPASVTVPAGMISMNFTLTARVVSAPTTVTVTARNGAVARTATLTVIPVGIRSMYISPVSSSGGQTVLVKAYLNGPAPSTGLSVRLTSSNPGVLPVPASIIIPPGASENGVLSRLSWVSGNTPVTVTGVSATAASTAMTVIPTQVISIGASIRTLRSLGGTGISLNLSGPAPTGGMTVYLRSSLPTILPVPASIFVPAGARSAAFTIKAAITRVLTPVTITATAGGVAKSVVITVTP